MYQKKVHSSDSTTTFISFFLSFNQPNLLELLQASLSPQHLTSCNYWSKTSHKPDVIPITKQESPADARVTLDSAIIPRWPSAAILDIIKPQIAPPSLKILA